jgi:hypothetical protein
MSIQMNIFLLYYIVVFSFDWSKNEQFHKKQFRTILFKVWSEDDKEGN